jgi:4-hydroxy-tetrahydrodipicolinate synthase
LSRAILEACASENFAEAEKLRQHFLPVEDMRDAWNPAKVLHHATQLAGIAETGPVLPFLSSLSNDQIQQLAPVAKRLLELDKNWK